MFTGGRSLLYCTRHENQQLFGSRWDGNLGSFRDDLSYRVPRRPPIRVMSVSTTTANPTQTGHALHRSCLHSSVLQNKTSHSNPTLDQAVVASFFPFLDLPFVHNLSAAGTLDTSTSPLHFHARTAKLASPPPIGNTSSSLLLTIALLYHFFVP